MEVKLRDIIIIILSVLLAKHASNTFWNTAPYEVLVEQNIINVTFSYTPPQPVGIVTPLVFLYSALILLGLGRINSQYLRYLVIITVIFIIVFVCLAFHTYVFKYVHIWFKVQGGKADSYYLQYESAKVLISGLNPYEVDFKEGIFKEVPGFFRTDILDENGTPIDIVSKIDYPAFSFLWYIPSALLGIEGIWQDLIALIVLCVLLFYLAPPHIKYLVPLPFIINGDYLFYTVGYIPDVAWVFLLSLAILSSNFTLSAIFLGLAISYKFHGFVFAPYYLIFIYRKYGLEKLKKYVGLVFTTVVLVNLPFMLWNPKAFFELVLLPILSNLPVFGLGLVSIMDAMGIELSRTTFAILTVLVLIITLIAYYKYPKIEYGGLVAFPMMVMWVYSRSFQNYMMWWPIIALAVCFNSKLNMKEIVNDIKDKLSYLLNYIKIKIKKFNLKNDI